MARFTTLGLLACTMLFSASASAATIMVSGINTVDSISPINTYKTNLADLELTSFTGDYGSVEVVGPAAQVSVYRVASESAFLNTMTAFGSGPIAEPEPQPLSGWTPDDLVASDPVFVGSLKDVINFFSNGSGPAYTFNHSSVGIFLPTGFTGTTYATQNLYVGFDDFTSNPDDNHDDYIIRISAVPEPATWLTMIAGFGMIGYTLRRSRKTANAAIA